jgi:hypothetical protein
MSDGTDDDLQRRYFGRGFTAVSVSCDSPGLDLVLHAGARGTDLAMDAGAANLAQDLRVALLTGTGTDLFNVAFGFDGLRVLTDPMTPSMTAEMLRLSVMKTVALDGRISRILDVRLEEIEPGSRHWVVEVELLTVLGEAVELTLGAVNTR